jgi:hypothetical protein
MSKKKPTLGGRAKKKAEVSLVRSSAAEYLTFVAAGGDSEASVEMRYEDENVWLTQKMMAALYDVSVPAVQFRKWANQIVKDYTIQGWTMDSERLKRGGILTDEFFERQLEKVREIRLSERKFYQKITDIYATALDYDPSATATKRFFAAVQNKMHFAVHEQTAAEVIVDCADHQKQNMGLTTWEAAPKGKVQRYDVSIAKNYLSDSEMGQMQRIVSAYLDMAEMQAMRKIPMTMEDWEKRLSGFLQLWDHEILQDAGRVTRATRALLRGGLKTECSDTSTHKKAASGSVLEGSNCPKRVPNAATQNCSPRPILSSRRRSSPSPTPPPPATTRPPARPSPSSLSPKASTPPPSKPPTTRRSPSPTATAPLAIPSSPTPPAPTMPPAPFSTRLTSSAGMTWSARVTSNQPAPAATLSASSSIRRSAARAADDAMASSIPTSLTASVGTSNRSRPNSRARCS